ncbi:7390_t:CDS:2, partial [Cetraspora pellucida]
PELGEFIEGAANVANILSPIIPMLSIITNLINEIFTIYEKAQFNKKILGSIIDRIVAVEAIMNILKSRTKCDEKFQDLQYQKSFLRFQDSLEKIKVFAEEVTQLRGVGKILCATSIKKKFNELMEEYEACMKDLSFTMIIIFDEQRRTDNDILYSALAKMFKSMKTSFTENSQQINSLYQE